MQIFILIAEVRTDQQTDKQTNRLLSDTEYGPALDLRNIVSGTFSQKHDIAKSNERK